MKPLFASLITDDQRSVESLAAEIAASDAVSQQKQALLEMFSTMPGYDWPEGRDTLVQAIDFVANTAALAAANSDSSRPKLIWTMTSALSWDGYSRPSTEWAGYSPDNIYRFAPIDDSSSYELTVQTRPPLPQQFSFLLWSGFLGENIALDQKPGQNDGDKTKLVDLVVGGLVDSAMHIGRDGTMTITMDRNPAGERINHIQITSTARVLFIRDVMNDWANQNFLDIQIKRIAGPTPTDAPVRETLERRAAHILEGGAYTLKWFIDDLMVKAPNTLETPWGRGGGFGFAGGGRYELAADQALVIHIDPLEARYLSVVLYDPWAVSRAHIRQTGSLNNRQAEANADGSFTFVVAATDPGVHNWLDTDGHFRGLFLTRWQVLPDNLVSAAGAVRSLEVVPLAEVPQRLPKVSRVSPERRSQLNHERACAFARHYGIPQQ